ncbi:MAG: glycosyltransferase [Thermogutta sp.]|uniref:glycosyltransferase n=1 Tax=Thermogutta sp. TaxID=1962930 RepID=UPI0019C4C18D|nr:glycosyltransferase [Thermogutta sp.]MBC7350812.1 glycosyltransferase [Thermogutta sp.]
MRILFVAPGGSVHTARWMSQLSDEPWELFLFPTELYYIRPETPPVTILDVENRFVINRPEYVTLRDRFYSAWGFDWPLSRGLYRAEKWACCLAPQFDNQAWRLARAVDRLRPDIVHSLGLHLGGYLTLAAKEFCKRPFPIWIATNWGSDLFLFGRLERHKERLSKVLTSIDYYWCECARDVELAKAWGVPPSKILPPVPVAGGFDVEEAIQLRQPGPVSARKMILLKGYQDWAGRALTAIYALRLCREVLQGYEVAIYTGGRDPEAVHIAGELLSQDVGINVTFIPPRTPHKKMLCWHGRARLSIGLSISDSIAISLLEAMLMGSFPIQSNTGAAHEWIQDGYTGFIVPPEDPYAVAEAVRQALCRDDLVDSAATINLETIKNRCDRRSIGKVVKEAYRHVVGFDSVDHMHEDRGALV